MRHFIVIPLEPVTKKNSQRVVTNRRTGAHFIKPSLKFEQYQNNVGGYFTYQKVEPVEPEFYPVNIRCNFYMCTNRVVDLTNLLEAIDDILVHYGVIVNDDYKHVAGHDGSRVFVDKDNPRTEIYFEPLTHSPAEPILFVCDGKACSGVCDPCGHTEDITHAKNFKPIRDNAGKILFYLEGAD